MIRETLTCIAAELNVRENSAKNPAIVSEIKHLGSEHKNHLSISLVNIEEELSLRNFAQINNLMPPMLHINLYILVAAHFIASNYAESLDSISRVISFFHQKPVFTPQNTEMPGKTIEKFTVEFFNLDLNKMAMLRQAIGAHYIPSVLYKVQLHYLPA